MLHELQKSNRYQNQLINCVCGIHGVKRKQVIPNLILDPKVLFWPKKFWLESLEGFMAKHVTEFEIIANVFNGGRVVITASFLKSSFKSGSLLEPLSKL